MAKLANFVGLMLLCGCGLLLESAAYPADIPPNPIKYRRYVRHRPDAKNPELEVYEVREIYVVRRPTPPPKKIKRMDDVEMEERILCDFEPTLPICLKYRTTPRTYWRSDRSPASVPTARPTTTTTTTTTEATTTTTEATTTTTTTDLPFLPTLKEDSPEVETMTEEEPEYDQKEDDPFDLDGDDEEDNEDVADDTDGETEQDAADYLNPSGSIGGNDMTK